METQNLKKGDEYADTLLSRYDCIFLENCFVIKLQMKSYGQKNTNVAQPIFNQRSMNVEKN